MTRTLDRRQRAMLAEMGIKVWSAASPAPPMTPAAPRNAIENVAASARPVALEAPKHPQSSAPAPAAAPLAPRPEGIEAMDWPALEEAVARCRACGLCAGRTQAVFGVGQRQADWMVVGEAPGEQEDRRGEPFVGPAGQLLDAMLAAVGVTRQPPGAAPREGRALAHQVYIANVLKCRPPRNRDPQPDEVAQCEPYLRRQVALVRPKVILALGRYAAQSLLATTEPIGRLRGRVHQYQGVPVVVSYHPAYLLRALPEKAKAWQDLCLARQVLGGERAPPA